MITPGSMLGLEVLVQLLLPEDLPPRAPGESSGHLFVERFVQLAHATIASMDLTPTPMEDQSTIFITSFRLLPLATSIEEDHCADFL